jgi:MFS transporter, DHA3 family, tetracycline resistance protein
VTNQSRKLAAPTVYLTMTAIEGFFWTMMVVIYAPYLIIDAHLGPFQLVLLGTILEGTILLFELPTGIVADAISRRVSIIIGYALLGASMVLTGAVPHFGWIVVADLMAAIGFTFISGADVAWITDEVGEQPAARLYLRGAQWSQGSAIVGIAAGVWLATAKLGLPFVVAGTGEIALALFLVIVMPEDNFTPQRVKGEKLRASFAAQWKHGVGAVRGRPALLLIFAVAALHGASTEGFDRLYALRFIQGTHLPPLGGLDRVVWWGLIAAGGSFLSIGATEFVKRRVEITSHHGAPKALAVINLLLIGSVVVFGFAPGFGLALAAFWMTAVLRSIVEPIFTSWVNQGLDSASRATVNSMWGQADALGQVAGGPVLGFIAAIRSVTSAIVVSGLLRAPALLLFSKTLRQGPLSAEDIRPLEGEGTGLEGSVMEEV